MSWQLLMGAGPNQTSKWVNVTPAKSIDYPLSVDVVGHNWTAGNVIMEKLVNGTPGNGPQSPYPPLNDTGSVVQIGQVPVGSFTVEITGPMEFFRVRTDAGVTGTVDVSILMDS
jgi:hypothetical protein